MESPTLRPRGTSRPLVMGIVNVTPDSFYDGGRHLGDRGLAHVEHLAVSGADVLDIGGESTRPGATPVAADEQLRRIEPAVRHALQKRGLLVSVDTTLPEVAERVLEWGVHWLNDVSCLRADGLARAVAGSGAKLVVMHSRADMNHMRSFSDYPKAGYDDVVVDVRREWCLARERALAAGLASEDLLFDPGCGFSKSAAQSLELVARIGEFRDLGVPIVVGPSRKSFIGALDGSDPENRLGGTVAACLWAVRQGASVLRVHDVHTVSQALLTYGLLEDGARSG